MSTNLKWEVKGKHLHLKGELTYETLRPLWLERDKIIKSIEHINVFELTRVDTGGLALLIHLQQFTFINKPPIYFSGITRQLYALITLYKLQKIINYIP
ncbi:lipid asymmetry maintenance protein MlaB [Candidatus Erwinia haradaeae]|uniref:Intermembrane phospholipid transport system binding protein MlaB n=1 Tax=Candidatus Erwinia haradaeae TaxID=1922217 RepID=A0A451D223_9GAMM|nr:lipid asymmetry maintenance protein MlaB [Candidatus Erwinia haradaeae]VFP79660.1 Intermembrane phospholipid transport system binding protein MlaB [Candidatus Erwinia haradaeae]